MRTKTLLIAAAALAAGVISSQAQVYSQNIVGYLNQSFVPGQYTLIENPLNLDGTNLADSVVGTTLQPNDSILTWTGTSYATYSYLGAGVGFNWQYPDGTYHTTGPTLAVGEGFFYLNGQVANETNTFVGTVVLSNSVSFSPGVYAVVASTPPIGDTLDGTNLDLPLQANDSVLLWNSAASSYETYLYLDAGPGFNWQYPDGTYQTTGPAISAGQGFFYLNGQVTSETWTNSITVQ